MAPAVRATPCAGFAIWAAVAASCWIVTVVSETAADCSRPCWPAGRTTRELGGRLSQLVAARLRLTHEHPQPVDRGTQGAPSPRRRSSSNPSTGRWVARSPAATRCSASDISSRRADRSSRSWVVRCRSGSHLPAVAHVAEGGEHEEQQAQDEEDQGRRAHPCAGRIADVRGRRGDDPLRVRTAEVRLVTGEAGVGHPVGGGVAHGRTGHGRDRAGEGVVVGLPEVGGGSLGETAVAG